MEHKVLKEFIESIVLETRQEDIEKIRMANNSYVAITNFIKSLNKAHSNFERVFKKIDGRYTTIALGAKVRREEHIKLYVNFLERVLSNAPPGHMASASIEKQTFHINIYFSSPPETHTNTKSYNRWFVNNIDQVLKSSKLRSYYVHEFIHSLDFRRMTPGYFQNLPNSYTQVSTPQYANAPLELNAYFLQRVNYFKRRLSRMETQQEKDALIGTTPQEFADIFLAGYANKDIREKLTPDNYRRLVKRAATVWELLKNS
jgi:hypothetical protein